MMTAPSPKPSWLKQHYKKILSLVISSGLIAVWYTARKSSYNDKNFPEELTIIIFNGLHHSDSQFPSLKETDTDQYKKLLTDTTEESARAFIQILSNESKQALQEYVFERKTILDEIGNLKDQLVHLDTSKVLVAPTDQELATMTNQDLSRYSQDLKGLVDKKGHA